MGPLTRNQFYPLVCRRKGSIKNRLPFNINTCRNCWLHSYDFPPSATQQNDEAGGTNWLLFTQHELGELGDAALMWLADYRKDNVWSVGRFNTEEGRDKSPLIWGRGISGGWSQQQLFVLMCGCLRVMTQECILLVLDCLFFLDHLCGMKRREEKPQLIWTFVMKVW